MLTITHRVGESILICAISYLLAFGCANLDRLFVHSFVHSSAHPRQNTNDGSNAGASTSVSRPAGVGGHFGIHGLTGVFVIVIVICGGTRGVNVTTGRACSHTHVAARCCCSSCGCHAAAASTDRSTTTAPTRQSLVIVIVIIIVSSSSSSVISSSSVVNNSRRFVGNGLYSGCYCCIWCWKEDRVVPKGGPAG
jgi:hypothetical protein